MSKNRLGEETSEYLLQHKDNPVHWYAWGEAALKAAKEQQKPVFLSIGYAACHWCHVMAHECFEDEEVAQIMNEHFINIKIDREERPDIDKIYMTALHNLGEQGGWPLNMFLTPQAEPFWGGTYFPKIPKYGRPGFTSILLKISEVFHKEPQKVEQNKRALIDSLKDRQTDINPQQQNIDMELVLQKLTPIMDQINGGPQGAPKFPQVPLLTLFWLGYQKSGNQEYKNITTTSLTHMSQGGIYDHLGGGYSRYSVDDNWLVPHFEKMIYDNAQLISVMCNLLKDQDNPLFRMRIEETIAWLVRDMRSNGGGFYASLDADSEGVEGKYYVWEEGEIKKALPNELADSFVKTYGVDSHGNWEGKTILNRLENLQLGSDEHEDILLKARDILFTIREERIKPGLDDKILADWNGLLITALTDASIIFDKCTYLDLARSAFAHIKDHVVLDGRLAHSFAKGKASHRAMLDDYAHMIRAGLGLYEATGLKTYLEISKDWVRELDESFWSEKRGAYFMSSAADPLLIIRMITASDEATPNGNAVMIENLVRLYAHTGSPAFYHKAEQILSAFKSELAQNIFAHCSYFSAQEFFHNYTEIMICPAERQKISQDIIFACLKLNAPHLILHQYTENIRDKNHPAYGKTAINGEMTFYLCKNRTCSQPVNTLDELKALI